MDIKGNPDWPRERIQEFLDREQPDGLEIQLPFGLFTNGSDPAKLKEIAFNNIQGKSLLAIGSSFGGFCIEALQNGASKAVGIELSRKHIQSAQTIAEILNVKPDFRCQDIEKIDFIETFDIIICLGVLHHLNNPIGVLQKLAKHARDKLILEVVSGGWHERRRLKIGLIQNSIVSSVPCMLVAPNDPRSLRQTYYFNKSAMKSILSDHNKIFRTVDFEASPIKNRFAVVAEKLHVARMVVVGGLTASGKSSFCDLFKSGEFSDLLAPMSDPETAWIDANQISKEPLHKIFTDKRRNDVVFHYDLSRKEVMKTYTYDRDVATDLMKLALRLDIVLVAPNLDTLQEQLEVSEILPAGKKVKAKYFKLRKFYRDPEWVAGMYSDYINFCVENCTNEIAFKIYREDGEKRVVFSAQNATEAKEIIREIYKV